MCVCVLCVQRPWGRKELNYVDYRHNGETEMSSVASREA